MHPVHKFKQLGNTEALREFFRQRALAELRASGQVRRERPSFGFQAYVRHPNGRVEDVTPGRARTSTPAPKARLSVGELRAQMEAIRTGIYNHTPAGRARAKVVEMERRAGEMETVRIVAEGRAIFADLLARNVGSSASRANPLTALGETDSRAG